MPVNKTRKQRGRGLANLFRKKAPLSSVPVTTPGNYVVENNSVNIVSYKKKQNLGNFITMKQKKSQVAKFLRNHIKKLKSLPNNVRNESFRLMNNTVRNKTRKLYNYPNVSSLSNDQLIELYTIGKVRSLSH